MGVMMGGVDVAAERERGRENIAGVMAQTISPTLLGGLCSCCDACENSSI